MVMGYYFVVDLAVTKISIGLTNCCHEIRKLILRASLIFHGYFSTPEIAHHMIPSFQEIQHIFIILCILLFLAPPKVFFVVC
jgi:hypothetical protein